MAIHAANMLLQAPAGTADPTNYPPGICAHAVTSGQAGYPFPVGMLVTHRAHVNAMAQYPTVGMCWQEYYLDNDSLRDKSSKTYTRTWNNTLSAWNEWTSARIVSDKAGNDLYVQTVEPDWPTDGDLWISPGAAVPANSVTVNASLFTTGNWYTIATSVGGDPAGTNVNGPFGYPRASARFVLEDGGSGRHSRIEFAVSMAYGRIDKASVRTIDRAGYTSTQPVFTKLRVVYKGTYDQWHVEVWCQNLAGASGYVKLTMIQDSDWLGGGFALNSAFGTVAPATPALSYLSREWMFATPEGSDTWTPVTFLNGWTDYNVAYAPGSYMLAYDGLVYLRGMVKASVANTSSAIFNLPAGLRPEFRELNYSAAGAPGALARIDVFAVANASAPVAAAGDVFLLNWVPSGAAIPTLAQSWVDLGAVKPFKPVGA